MPPRTSSSVRVEIDVGTFDTVERSSASGVALATRPATVSIPAVFPDVAEVLIYDQEGGAQLVAALELVSPRNKDRVEARQAFVAKMSAYLQQAVALAVVDLVTSRTANLHNEWAEWMQAPAARMPPLRNPLYANSYRPVQHGEHAEIEMWLNPLQLGDPLPDLPLFLRADLCIELPLEETYLDTCGDQRIAVA